MSEPSADPRHEKARLLYVESALSLREISRRIGVPHATVSTWANRFGWPPRKPAVIRRVASAPASEPQAEVPTAQAPRKTVARTKRPKVGPLVDRLYRIITHNLEQMETRMSDETSPTTADAERDMRAIGNAVRSIEKLTEIQPEHAKRDTAVDSRRRRTPEEEDRIRHRIVEHIMRVRERSRREQGND